MADFRDDLDLDLEAAETQASDLREGRRIALDDEDSSDSDTIDQEIARHPTHVSRRETQNLQHLHTVGSTRLPAGRESVSLKFGGGRPFPPLIREAREAYVVDFDGPDDPIHPFNWRLRDKYLCC
jgi:MFS transporter, DHA1 family, multidrug resistance protein